MIMSDSKRKIIDFRNRPPLKPECNVPLKNRMSVKNRGANTSSAAIEIV
jgi:hypothetical protein